MHPNYCEPYSLHPNPIMNPVEVNSTGVPRSLKTALPQGPTGGLCLGPYGGPRGGAASDEQGTPVPFRA